MKTYSMLLCLLFQKGGEMLEPQENIFDAAVDKEQNVSPAMRQVLPIVSFFSGESKA
jgi:hypothetical protein